MSQFMLIMSEQFTITLERRFQAGNFLVNFCPSLITAFLY